MGISLILSNSAQTSLYSCSTRNFSNCWLEVKFTSYLLSLPQLSDKDFDYLEERIKRSSKNRPSTAPSENTAKSSVSVRGGSDSTVNGAKKKDEKKPGKAQIAR